MCTNIKGLPLFILRLATEVDWDNERQCFSGIALELARFYSYLPHTNAGHDSNIGRQAAQIVTNDIMPALRHFLVPQNSFTEDGTVVQVADLESLYKVFERC